MGLSVFFVGVSALNLDDFPIVTSDEGWVMSTPYKLTTQGIFGTDLYAGLFDTEPRTIVMPVHYLLVALSFKLVGPGVAQARWVSLLFGVSILWFVGWLAYRWYGLAVALLTQGLLLFWRSVLMAYSPGIPLLVISRTARYDVGALAWIWATLFLLNKIVQQPDKRVAFALGLCAALATLTQFFGLFVVPLIVLVWLWHRGKQTWTDPATYWMIAGFLVVMIPYAAYALPRLNDLVAQLTLMQGERFAFDSPTFYLDALLHEPRRFAHLLQKATPGPWLLILGTGPALFYVWRRVKRTGQTGDRILLLSVLIFGGLLALIEQTKSSGYAIVLLPSLCMAMALFFVRVLRWSRSGKRPMHRATRYLITGWLALVLLEGFAAHAVDQWRSHHISNYLEIGERMGTHLEPGTRIAGPERWWWALRDHPYVANGNLYGQWRAAAQAQDQQPDFSNVVRRAAVDYILVHRGGDIMHQPETLKSQFWDFLDTSCTLIKTVNDEAYGEIEIYRVLETRPGPTRERP